MTTDKAVRELRDLAGQGHGPRTFARITGCSERTIRQLSAAAAAVLEELT